MGVPGGVKNPDGEDWYVEGSDDEKYDAEKTGTGVWEPSPEEIISLYERLEKEKVLKLHWKCPGRRPPKSDVVQEEDQEEETSEQDEVEQVEEKPQQPTEFDFDEDEGKTGETLSLRRTPGTKTPKSQKKRATMDKVLHDVMMQRKQNAAEKEARRLGFSKSPKGANSPRVRPSFGTPPRPMSVPSSPFASPMGMATTPVNIGASPSRAASVTTTSLPVTPVRTPLTTSEVKGTHLSEQSVKMEVDGSELKMTMAPATSTITSDGHT